MTTRACSNSRRSSASSFPTDFTATLRFPTNCAAATSVGSRVDAVKCPNCQNESCNQSILGPSIAASGGPVRPGDFLSILLSIGRQGGRAAREMAACGRKRPVVSAILVRSERPLWRKADIQLSTLAFSVVPDMRPLVVALR